MTLKSGQAVTAAESQCGTVQQTCFEARSSCSPSLRFHRENVAFPCVCACDRMLRSVLGLRYGVFTRPVLVWAGRANSKSRQRPQLLSTRVAYVDQSHSRNQRCCNRRPIYVRIKADKYLLTGRDLLTNPMPARPLLVPAPAPAPEAIPVAVVNAAGVLPGGVGSSGGSCIISCGSKTRRCDKPGNNISSSCSCEGDIPHLYAGAGCYLRA